jgi:hypothetical protein
LVSKRLGEIHKDVASEGALYKVSPDMEDILQCSHAITRAWKSASEDNLERVKNIQLRIEIDRFASRVVQRLRYTDASLRLYSELQKTLKKVVSFVESFTHARDVESYGPETTNTF